MAPRKTSTNTRRNATRKVALVVFSTLRKIGKSRGVTLKTIYQYIKDQYPSSSSNMIRLSNTIQKAMAFGAVNKKSGNRYVLGRSMKSLTYTKSYGGVTKARRVGNRRRSARSRGRSRRARSRARRRR